MAVQRSVLSVGIPLVAGLYVIHVFFGEFSSLPAVKEWSTICVTFVFYFPCTESLH